MAVDPSDLEIGAISIPPGTRVPQPAELANLLLAKVERGYALSRLGSAAALVGALGFAISGDLAVATGFVVGAALCGLAMWGLTKKRLVGRHVLADPSCVTRVRQRIMLGRTRDLTFISLDLAGGGTFEVGMSPDEIVSVAAWLRARNPAVKVAG
jgi:hypothetical protein